MNVKTFGVTRVRKNLLKTISLRAKYGSNGILFSFFQTKNGTISQKNVFLGIMNSAVIEFL